MSSFVAIIPGMAGWSEIVLVLALALILFGPKRLPEIAEAMGKSIRKFKSATKSATDEVKREIDDVGREMNNDAPRQDGKENGKADDNTPS
ncbi:MAG: twin-arginine translocase TatA/TatE family subunit [Candidatus Krumholzibacteriota bacterium]